jgi:predicted enzyme related to lactoylglutathione lyase
VAVKETFFSIEVADMERAVAFYVAALGASVVFSSPRWTSLHIAGVRVALAHSPAHAPGRVGLHFAVTHLAKACGEIQRAGGRTASAVEVAPGVVVVDATDPEGNVFALAGDRA